MRYRLPKFRINGILWRRIRRFRYDWTKRSGGLNNRIRTQIRLEPFTLAECEEYARELGLGYDRHHVLECYMALGGVAYYWSLLEKGRSPDQNIDLLFFSRREELRTEFDELYSSLFTNPEPYVRIISVLGRHRQGLGRDEIARAVANVAVTSDAEKWARRTHEERRPASSTIKAL